jgi:S-adenosylmethionine:tRNA-ribosyltransferase-isomerase (queuine synthetase)
MKKYNLEKLFNEVDQIKERLETTKKEHEKEVNLLMKPFENKTQVKVQTKIEKIVDSDDEKMYLNEESAEEEKPVPKKKATKKSNTKTV